MFCTKCGSPVSGNFCRNCGAPASDTPTGPAPAAAPPVFSNPVPADPVVPPPGFAPPPRIWNYAQWTTRVLGYLIDFLIVGAGVVVLGVAAALLLGTAGGLGTALTFGGMQGLGGAGCCMLFSIFPLATLGVGIYNKVYLVAQRGSSIGQGVVKIKVVDAQGNLLSTGNAALRLLTHVGLSFIPFGSIVDLLWPLWDERRQTLHDKAVGCYVINCQ